MIVFHEGLPGAGKSYEAAVMQIVPALQQARTVVTNIEGISVPKLAEVTKLPPAIVEMLIVPLDIRKEVTEQRADILEQTKKDSLVVLDEIQDIFPAGREQLPSDWMTYITQHRHEGLDIVLMGQDLTDVHKIWRNRVQRVVYFTNLEAVAGVKRYRWEVAEKQGKKFVKVSSGVRKYDPQYFGIYASHTAGTENTDTYGDSRSRVITPKKVAGFVVVLGGLLWFGVSGMMGFLDPSDPGMVADADAATEPGNHPVSAAGPSEAREPARPETLPSARLQDEAGPPPEPPPLDYFDRLARKHRLRLGGLIEGSDGSFVASVQVMATGNREHERFRVPEVEALGWRVQLEAYGLRIMKEDTTHIVRPWSLDLAGRVSGQQRDVL